MYTATSRPSFESEITIGFKKREISLLNAVVILYTIPPDAPWYFHLPIKASGAKRAKKCERLARVLLKEKAPYYRTKQRIEL